MNRYAASLLIFWLAVLCTPAEPADPPPWRIIYELSEPHTVKLLDIKGKLLFMGPVAGRVLVTPDRADLTTWPGSAPPATASPAQPPAAAPPNTGCPKGQTNSAAVCPKLAVCAPAGTVIIYRPPLCLINTRPAVQRWVLRGVAGWWLL